MIFISSYENSIVNEAINRYKEGESVTSIAKNEKMPSRSTIYKWINKKNVDLKNPKKSNINYKTTTKEEEEKIIKDYKNSNLYVKDIAKKYNVSIGKIYRLTDGIYRDSPFSHPDKIGYNNSIKDKAEELYNSEMSLKEISNILNVHFTSVSKWLKRRGYKIKRGIKNKIGNEEYFDEINTEDKAYFLGWLMADGNVSIYDGQYSIKLGVSLKDKIIIDGFIKHIESQTEPYINKGSGYSPDKEYYRVSLTSVHMVKSLFKYGIKPNKTGSEIIPDINNKYIRHFIRGYFDGDGVTDIVQNRSGFVGPKEILIDIQKNINVNKTIYQNKNVCCFQSGIKFSKKLYNYLYSNANIWLPRKRNRMDLICGNTEVTNKSKNLLVP